VKLITPITQLNQLAHMYRIVLACKGVSTDAVAVAERDITEEFTHKP